MFHQYNKKGISTTIFTWIFVAIAGILIIIFFVTFAFRHAETSETVSSIRYLDTLNNIITSFATSQQADKTVNLPTKIEAYFDCEGILMTYNNRDYTKRTPGNIIFATEKLKDDKLLLWTQPWKLPYKVTNIIYLSAPNIKYFLIYDTNSQQTVDEIKSELPSRFQVESLSINELNPRKIDTNLKNNYKNKFVFFTTPQKLNEIFQMNTPASVVQIDEGDYGQVTYYFNGAQRSTPYITRQLIYGAIFTDDYDTYSCLVTRSMNHLGLVTSLYSEKARLLLLKTTKQCSYGQIKQTLDNFGNIAKTLNMQELYLISQSLIGQNRQLDNQGCSTIF